MQSQRPETERTPVAGKATHLVGLERGMQREKRLGDQSTALHTENANNRYPLDILPRLDGSLCGVNVRLHMFGVMLGNLLDVWIDVLPAPLDRQLPCRFNMTVVRQPGLLACVSIVWLGSLHR